MIAGFRVLTQRPFPPPATYDTKKKWYKYISVLMRTKCNTQTEGSIQSSFSTSKLLTMELGNLENRGVQILVPQGQVLQPCPWDSWWWPHGLKLGCQLHWLPPASPLWLSWIRSVMVTDGEGRGRRKSKGPKGSDHHFWNWEWARKIF